jgi:hypothetical protein
MALSSPLAADLPSLILPLSLPLLSVPGTWLLSLSSTLVSSAFLYKSGVQKLEVYISIWEF